MPKRIAFHTLGCKLNYSETSALSGLAEKEGYVCVPFEDEADVYVINSCAVTAEAEKACRYVIRRIRRRAPGANVVATGCYAQLRPKELSGAGGADMVIGTADKFNLFALLRQKSKPGACHSCASMPGTDFHSAFSFGGRTRAFLKVQDGCSYNCSYCTIPLARGESRSATITQAVQDAEHLAAQGVKEIVLTGVNTGDFGTRNSETFLKLLQKLDRTEGIARFRISSIEPNLLNDDIIEFVADSRRFVPHFHIPLQSGSDRILGLMRRRYRRSLYRDRVEKIRQFMPEACIGADVITGFPSESDDDYKDTYDFINGLEVSYLHVFPYSERPHTDAVHIEGVVPIPVRQERSEALRGLSDEKRSGFYSRFEGSTRTVLWEEQAANGLMPGLTGNYIRVYAPYVPASVNTLEDVRLAEGGPAGAMVKMPAGHFQQVYQ